MGREKKKVGKNKKRQQEKIIHLDNARHKEILHKQMEDGEYAKALDTVVKLIEGKCNDPEVMYVAAQAYFFLGDYERTAAWVNNTLHYNDHHIGARLLLARVCLLKDREEDALKLYDLILNRGTDGLTDAEEEDILESTDYIVRTNRAWLEAAYPRVMAFINERKHEADAAIEFDMSHTSKQISYDDHSVTAILNEIMDKRVSLQEKIKILNAFAGGFYVEQDYPAAQHLLEKALELDACADETLRNMAVLHQGMGRREEALQYASQMSVTDFTLLNLLS